MKYDQNDNTRSSRLQKIGYGLTGLAAGAFLLKESGNMKYISKAIEDVGSTISKVSEDLSTKAFKDLDYTTLKGIAKDRLLDDNSTWKTARNTLGDIELDYSRGSLSSLLQYNKINGSDQYLANEMYDSFEKTHVTEALHDSFKGSKHASDEFFGELTKLVDESLSKKNTFFEESEQGKTIIQDELDNRLKGSILEEHKNQIANVMQTALADAENLETDFKIKYNNEAKDPISSTFKEEIINKYTNKKDSFFKNTLDRAATVNDLLENLENKSVNVTNNQLYEGTHDTLQDTLRSLVDEDARFGNMVVDNATLRVDKNGQLYSTKAINDLKTNVKEEAADTIMGKLFGVRNFTDNAKAPDFYYFGKGSYDSIIAHLTDSKNGILNYDVFKLGDKVYKYNNGEINQIADNIYLTSGRHGSNNILLNRIHGNIDKKIQNNKTLQWLDFNTTGTNEIDKLNGLLHKFNKNSSWISHIPGRLFDESNYLNPSDEAVSQFQKDIKAVNRLYNHRTFAPSKRSLNELKNVMGPHAAQLIKAFDEKNAAEYLLGLGDFNFVNEDLKTLLSKYKKNVSATHTMAQIGHLGGKNGMNVLRYNDLLKREIVKEVMLKDAESTNQYTSNFIQGYAISHSKLNSLNISGGDRKNIENLFNWGIFQKETSSFANRMHKASGAMERRLIMSRFGTIVDGASANAQTDAFFKNFRQSVNSFIKSGASLKDVVHEADNSIQKGYRNNEWVAMRKTVTPMDLIKSLNDTTKFNATAKDFGMQFIAGKKSTGNITTATLYPYHLVNRLVAPMEAFGLGLSGDNIGSVADLTKNLALKRILPAILLAKSLSYANFEAENLTGNSFTQDYYNFRANFGLGLKTIQQVTGMSDNLKSSRMYNPILNYWMGDYKDKEDYQDYLENGYDPVRKGRWWSFGSASELRGGKISYWEPNKIRQAYSHYKDVSLYGSTDEKWKHSLIPTLRHPLSPLRFLLNPYWLEEKHYWDRPYPVTAPLFDEETPWGAILNPTIGQIIKPVKRMHQSELGHSLLDVRTIIARHNQDIRNKAADNRVIRVDDGGFTPMDYHPNSMPSLNEAVYTVGLGPNGKVTGGGFEGEEYAGNMANVSHTVVPVVTGKGGRGIKVSYSNVNNSPGTIISNMAISGLSRLITSGLTSGNTALGLISGVNSGIKNKAEFQSRGVINENANYAYTPYQVAAQNAKDKFIDKLNINDIGTKSDFVNGLMYSGKELAGMYGFLFDSILPARHGYQLENAGNMKSFVHSFWDENLGGWGGEFMEITRRFFPHENHDIEQINPLRNTMPLWLPDRFQTGDPFTKVTKGEARLPGAGYETLNRLHPDQYGRYGAFDRYKILADVAPGSDEYKTWKKISKEEISSNPYLKKEMSAIEKRVQAQSSNHQFYNYEFLHKHMDTQHAVIESVTNAGVISVVGSNQKYSMAGIKPLQDSQTKQGYIQDYLKPGMMVDLEFEDNKYRNKDKNGNIAAIVNATGTNINRKMWEEKKANQKDTLDTLADKRFAETEGNKVTGALTEFISHAQIPYLHNKYLRVDSPMESYKKEQIYGNNYSTWTHPIKGFIEPAFQTGWSKGIAVQALGLASWYWSNAAREKGLTGFAKYASHAAFAFTNPYALIGGIVGGLPKMNWGSHASNFGWNSKNGANISATIGIIGYGFAHLNNPFLSAASFGVGGFSLAHQLKIPATEFPSLSKLLKVSEEEGKVLGGKEGAIFGAGVGLALSALKNPQFSLTHLTDKYIPGRTKKKWEMEEYFDRLEYLKYMNLYKQAARLAKRKDGVDIARIVNKFEYNQDKNDKVIAKLQRQKERVQMLTPDAQIKSQLTATIDSEINRLSVPEQYYSMGKYTKAALAYKKAADTTIYGLNKHSSMADVLRALPKYDRDYFLEFANEKDPHERKKILKMISPYKQKALHVLWGDKMPKQKSNKEFFSTHNLPNMFWSGWRSDVDLDNVKMKTIENQGMLLSDFGYYDSSKYEPAYQKAPEINNIHSHPSPIALQRDMLTLLNGAGLQTASVSVEPSQASGLQIVTNIGRITQYNLQQKVQNVMYKLF